MGGLDAQLTERLTELAAKHEVVGASLAVRTPDATGETAYGLTNLATGVPVDTNTVFHIGSISKVYTATLVMQLADEGRLDIDAPVTDTLPGFTVADSQARSTITTRQLLSHTSGLDGDVFTDFGRGDDCVQRYVDSLAEVEQTSRPGELFSYCNAGYVVLGRMVEVLRECTWDEAVRRHIAEPLGLADTVTLPEDVLLRRAAVGHLTFDPAAGPEPTKLWQLPRSLGPAGLITATARDVVGFALAHLNHDGALLHAGSFDAMRAEQVRVPDSNLVAAAWGLGWILYDSGSRPVIGHDGATMGQQGYLRVAPEAGVVVALLTNGGRMGGLAHDLLTDLLDEYAGITLRQVPSPPAAPVEVDLAPFTGRYERAAARYDISRDGDRLRLDVTPLGPLAEVLPREDPKQLVPLDSTHLVTLEEDPRLGQHIELSFIGDPRTGFSHLHSGGRATPRIGSSSST